ncbi:MAG: hypothetical protein ACLUIO_00605 [Neglectibacter timonensis]
MKNQRYIKKQFDSKIKSTAMNYYDARFRNMSTQFDAGYCKGVLDTIFLMLNILGVQCTKEWFYKSR